MTTETFNFSAARVALLDASDFAASVTRNILTGFGFRQIVAYRSTEEAAEMLLRAPADILLCDPFPEVDKTFVLLSALRTPRYREFSMAPFVITTAQVSVDVIKAAKNCKADFVIAKPFSPRVLLDRLIFSAKKDGRRNALTLPDAMIAPSGGAVDLW